MSSKLLFTKIVGDLHAAKSNEESSHFSLPALDDDVLFSFLK